MKKQFLAGFMTALFFLGIGVILSGIVSNKPLKPNLKRLKIIGIVFLVFSLIIGVWVGNLHKESYRIYSENSGNKGYQFSEYPEDDYNNFVEMRKSASFWSPFYLDNYPRFFGFDYFLYFSGFNLLLFAFSYSFFKEEFKKKGDEIKGGEGNFVY